MARKDISMTPAEVATFLDAPLTAILTTLGRDGHPHSAPMWYFMSGDRIAFRSFTKSQKIVNLRRDPRVTAVVSRGLAYEELQWVMFQGTAHLVDGAEHPDVLLDAYGRLAARYPMAGGEPVEMDSGALEQAFGRFAPKNTLVTIEPKRVISVDHTKLGGVY